MSLLLQLASVLGQGSGGGTLGFTNNVSVMDFALGIDSLAGIEIDANGDVQGFTSGGPGAVEAFWGQPDSFFTRSDYDYRVDFVSGDSINFGNTQDTWIAGSGFPSWGLERTTNGNSLGTWTMRMRPTGGGADIGVSRTLTLESDREP